MHGHRFLSSLIVTAALLAPGLGQTVASAQKRVAVKVGPVTVRVYDRAHKDYHVWDDHEDRTYRQYLGDQHKKYRRFSRLNQKKQTTYWNYRHSHAG
jgi:hypothetical protein